MKFSRTQFSLHGLRAQVLLWTVLPLTILLIIFSMSGVSSHQNSMRSLAVVENTRLIETLATLVSTRSANYALKQGIAEEDVSPHDLDLDSLLSIDHPDSINMLVMIDKKGNILYNRGLPALETNITSWPGIDAVLSGKSGVSFTSDTMHGDIIAYAPIADLSWSLVIRESWHSLTDPLIRFEQVMPFILFIAMAVSFTILFFGIRFVVQPLRELRFRANLIGQGQFDAVSQSVGGVQEIEELRVTLHNTASNLQSHQLALHDYAGAVTRAQEEERGRLGRELHDETIQTLIAIDHKVQMAQRTLERDSAQTSKTLTELRQMTAGAINEVRRFSTALHPHYLEELGLISALENLAGYAGASLKIMGSPIKMPKDKELTLYRVAQEALNNAHRHADAQNIQMILQFQADNIVLRIADDGKGFEVPNNFIELTKQGHYGLLGMKERAQFVNGVLKVTSRLDMGTSVNFLLSTPTNS